MTENGNAEAPFISNCDGCDETHPLQPDAEGRMLLCDECKAEYESGKYGAE